MWLVEGPNENRRVTMQRAYRTQEAFTIAATKLEEKFGEYVAANERLLHDKFLSKDRRCNRRS
jgi:hypothetical protein